MLIAILSDIHDNIWNLKKVLKRVKEEKCKAILFCGDYCAPSTFKILAGFGLPLYAVFGNVDGAHYEIMRAIQENEYQVVQRSRPQAFLIRNYWQDSSCQSRRNNGLLWQVLFWHLRYEDKSI